MFVAELTTAAAAAPAQEESYNPGTFPGLLKKGSSMGLLSFLRSIFRVDQKPSPTRRAGDPILTSFGLSAVSVGEHEISLPPVRIDFSDEDDFETDVVGESFRQDNLAALAGRVDVDSRGR
ncbi:MAG TPA: hypothetical protein VIL35_07090, partial [Vicinamibacterales bacterium]